MKAPLPSHLLDKLRILPHETQWLAFNSRNLPPERMGELICALSNTAALHGEPFAYLAWGVEAGSRLPSGTSFRPDLMEKDGEDLTSWLARNVDPHLDFKFHQCVYEDARVVVLEIPAASMEPVRFGGEALICKDGELKPLQKLAHAQRSLLMMFSHTSFEAGITLQDASANVVLESIDIQGAFHLLKLPLPNERSHILQQLVQERLILAKDNGLHDITNLCAILFANDLGRFPDLQSKSPRVVVHDSVDGSAGCKVEKTFERGYALDFEDIVTHIRDNLPFFETPWQDSAPPLC